MKAAVYDRPGDPDVLRYTDVPDPACAADGLVIRVRAISVEGGDTINRATQAPPRPAHVVPSVRPTTAWPSVAWRMARPF